MNFQMLKSQEEVAIKVLAEHNGVLLWDRDKLQELIEKANNTQ